MANSFTADFPEIWSRVQQEQLFKKTVAAAVADVSMKSQMSVGDTFNKPYRSVTSVQSYTRGTSITIDDKTDTQDQLVINSQYATGFYIDDFDKIQSRYDLIANYASDDADRLNIQIDQDILAEYANAASTVDDGDIGGTDGNAIALTSSNVLQVFAVAREKLAKQNVVMDKLFAAISPEVESVLVQYGAGRDTQQGDRVNNNGFIGRFYGFDLYGTNNLSGSAVLSLATNPTDTDTVTIGGITFTFVDTIGTTAGNIHIEGTVDATRANLAELINAPGTTDAGQVALSAANQRIVSKGWSATNDDDADTLTVVAKGVGRLVVSSDLTDGTDTWTATKQVQHNVFGRKGAISMVIQRNAMPKIKEVETKLGVNVLNGVLYGIKTFNKGTKELVDVQIKSSAFTAGASNY